MDRRYTVWQVIKLVLKHKFWVFVAGLKFRVPLWQLIVHDISKLYPSEILNVNHELPISWNHHQNRNRHHCEYWYARTGGRHRGDFKNPTLIPMPEKYVREMIADWFAAAKHYDGDWPPVAGWEWLEKNFGGMLLHPLTRLRIFEILRRKGYLRNYTGA